MVVGARIEARAGGEQMKLVCGVVALATGLMLAVVTKGALDEILDQGAIRNPGYAVGCGYTCQRERRADRRTLDRLVRQAMRETRQWQR